MTRPQSYCAPVVRAESVAVVADSVQELGLPAHCVSVTVACERTQTGRREL